MNYLMTKAETKEIAENIIDYFTSEYFKSDMYFLLYIFIKLLPIILLTAILIVAIKIYNNLKSIEKLNEKMLEKISKTENNNNSDE